MTERDTRREGLFFTGCYNFCKDDMKEKAASIRKEYKCKAVVVFVKGDRRDGYSVYAGPEYGIAKRIKSYQSVLDRLDSQKQELLNKYKLNLDHLESKAEEARKYIADHS
jgi:hypothetical protein